MHLELNYFIYMKKCKHSALIKYLKLKPSYKIMYITV